jgi:hypothetical protein
MENKVWDDEVSTDNDLEIAHLEAEIAREKSFLAALSNEEDLF